MLPCGRPANRLLKSSFLPAGLWLFLMVNIPVTDGFLLRHMRLAPRTYTFLQTNNPLLQIKTKPKISNISTATYGQPTGDDESDSSKSENPLDNFEESASSSWDPTSALKSMVHSMTGSTTYKFGDFIKRILSDVTGRDLDEEPYQLGDISKSFVNEAGKLLTGDEDYQISDFTESKMQEIEGELDEWKEQNLNELPNSLFQRTLKSLPPMQQQEAIFAFVRFAAIALLSWGLVSNILSSGVLSMAWTRTLLEYSRTIRTDATLPLVPFCGINPFLWRNFLASYTTFNLFLDPLLLVLKGCGALFIFEPYAQSVGVLERKWPPERMRKQYPLVCRAFALVTAFALNNVVLPSLFAIVGLSLGGTSVRLIRCLPPS